MNEQKGITLVSVVVTVVVILIITVISINSEDGMIEQAQKTTSVIDEKIVKEENRMAEHDVDNVLLNYRGVYNVTVDGIGMHLVIKSNKIIATTSSTDGDEGVIINIQHKIYNKKIFLNLVPEEEKIYVEEEIAILEKELGPIDGFITILPNTEEEQLIGAIINGGKQIYLLVGETPTLISKEEKAPNDVRNILEKTKGKYVCYTDENDRIVIIDYKNEMINTHIGVSEFSIGTSRKVKIVENNEIYTLKVNDEDVAISENALYVIENGKTSPEAIIDGNKIYVPESIFTSEGDFLKGETITFTRATLSNGSDAAVLTENLGYRITDLGYTAK